jgi:hypothetical protein
LVSDFAFVVNENVVVNRCFAPLFLLVYFSAAKAHAVEALFHRAKFYPNEFRRNVA